MNIWKFEVPIDDYFSISMPTGADILSFQCQGSQPVIWAVVDPNAEKEERRFMMRGTGHDIITAPEDRKYIGTAQMGPLVWHLFELLN